MYEHHKASLAIMEQMFRNRSEVIALIFGGSVAKGTERADSDLDGMAVVTDEYYNTLQAENRVAEVIPGHCTYEGGYFDIKYMTKDFLRHAAKHASEPTRNAFVKSKVLFTHDPEIIDLVSEIPVFQESEQAEKMLSFYCDLQLNYGYFWKGCKPEGYMRIRTASEIVYCIYRLILQENRVLFPCSRRLEETAAQLENKPKNIIALCQEFCRTLDDELPERILDAYHGWTSWQHPTDQSLFCSQYATDFERWWLNPRPLISEW